MTPLPRNYDDWRLSGPDDGEYIGQHEGETCNRVEEPDEDSPRPRPCGGMMVEQDGETFCNTCEALA